MNHPDNQLMIARDIQRDRLQRAEQYRLARTARAARRRRPTWSTRTHRVSSWSGQLEAC